MWVTGVVPGNQFFFAVLQDSREGAVRRPFESRVHFLSGGGLLSEGYQVYDGDVGRGNAHGVAVELAFEFREHQSDGLGRARGGGDHGKSRRPRPAQVLMGQVEYALVVGVSVDGSHRALEDLEVLMDYLYGGSQAVRGAGSIGNNMMFGWVVHLLVHTQHDGKVFTLGGSGDDDLFHRALQMLLRVLRLREKAGRFHHHLDAQRGPVQLRRIFHLENADAFVVDPDTVLTITHLGVQNAEDRVIFQQVSQRPGVGDVVDRHDFNFRVVQGRTKEVPTDTPEAVDSNLNSHFEDLRVRFLVIR